MHLCHPAAYSSLSLRLRRLGSAKIAATVHTGSTGGHRRGRQHDCAHKFMPLAELILPLRLCIPAAFFFKLQVLKGRGAATCSQTQEYCQVTLEKVRPNINIG